MAINKVFGSFAEAVADVPDSATVMLTSFGSPGPWPQRLTLALRDQGARNLTLVATNLGMAAKIPPKPGEVFGSTDVLVENGQVKKGISAFFITHVGDKLTPFGKAYFAGEIEIECLPFGNLIERIRAAGAGMGPFYTAVGVGTVFDKGKEKRIFNGKKYMLEHPLSGDFGFIRAYKADKMGNLVYKGTSRGLGPVFAPACKVAIAEVDEIVEVGELDPEAIATPGIFIDRIVKITEPGIYPRDTRYKGGTGQ